MLDCGYEADVTITAEVRYRMEEPQRQFRLAYQQRISRYYNGWLHGLWIFGFGFAYIAWSLSHLFGAQWAWLSVIPAYLFSNLGEWWLHRHVLHKRVPGLRALWQRHTVEHHHYFSPDHMTVDSHREYRIMFFPPYAVFGIALIHLGLGALWALIFGPNAGWLWMTGGMLHYLSYEVLHTAAHLHESPLLARLPIINTMRRNHWVHHHQNLMTDCNLNLTIPFADWLFTTSDLDRGLWGIVTNGYRMDRVKGDVRKRLGVTEFGQVAPGERHETRGT